MAKDYPILPELRKDKWFLETIGMLFKRIELL